MFALSLQRIKKLMFKYGESEYMDLTTSIYHN
jgi:hypothetical protein